jgi:hypothetical protein
LQRVEEPMERLRLLGNALTATPEGVALEAQYTQLVTALKEAESAIVLRGLLSSWADADDAAPGGTA